MILKKEVTSALLPLPKRFFHSRSGLVLLNKCSQNFPHTKGTKHHKWKINFN